MKLNKNRKKHKSFADFIQNDKKTVMPLLGAMSVYSAVVIWNVALAIAVLLKTDIVFICILAFFAVLSIRNVVKFIRAGGSKIYEGVSTQEIVNPGDKK